MSAATKSAVPGAAKQLLFIGMPAAGKTYWGKRVAQHYHLYFVDLDTLIEEKEKASIASLFDLYGEIVFWERVCLVERTLLARRRVSPLLPAEVAPLASMIT